MQKFLFWATYNACRSHLQAGNCLDELCQQLGADYNMAVHRHPHLTETYPQVMFMSKSLLCYMPCWKAFHWYLQPSSAWHTQVDAAKWHAGTMPNFQGHHCLLLLLHACHTAVPTKKVKQLQSGALTGALTYFHQV